VREPGREERKIQESHSGDCRLSRTLKIIFRKIWPEREDSTGDWRKSFPLSEF